jgi:mRNA interferase HigB
VEVLGIGVLNTAIKKHGNVAEQLRSWLKITRGSKWTSLVSVRKTWRNADTVEGKTVFNIKGNKYRLITIVNYATGVVIVKAVLTHAEYMKDRWKK